MINQSILSIERSIATDVGSISITGTVSGIPIGGAAGQVLAKQSNGDYDTHWINQQASNAEFLLQTVYNGPGSTISKGEVVYVVGAQGTSVIVDRAIASFSHDSEVIGVALDSILSNQTGIIVIHGIINGLNTNSFSEGDRLYLSPTSYGQITNVEPSAPNHAVLIGYCVKKGLADGSIYVNVNDGQHLKELHDVNVDSAVSGQYLFLDNDQIWKNKTIEYADVSGLTGILSGLYPRSNPSGFITATDGLVYTTGNQTISGIKTFQEGLEVGSMLDVSTLYILSGAVGVNNENPQASLDVSGSTLFSERPTVNGTGVLLSGDIDTSNFYTNNNPSGYITGISHLVYTTGDQTISGRKLFSQGLDAGLQVGVSTLYIGTGLVGVNNEDPQAALHVSGSALFANDVTILGNFAVSGTTYINEVIDVTTTGIISGVTGVFQHLEADNILYSETSSYVVAQPGDDLAVKYAEAVALTPNGSAKSTTNRASLIIMPGSYALSAELAINDEFVDIIGLGAQTQKPVVFITSNTLNISANDVRVSGISVGSQRFEISGNKPLQIFENCTGGDYSFNVGYEEQLSGTFVNCIAGNDSFDAGVYGNVNGKFTNCIAGNYSFGGASYGRAGGTFTNCTGGNNSFGGTFATGTFTNCKAGNNSFGSQGDYAVVSGIFTNCIGGDGSFASKYGGAASGTFTGCTAGSGSFGGYYCGASGKFLNCVAGEGSFGGIYSSAGGTFTNCVAGASSFGLHSSLANGVFFNCRVTEGEFPNPSVRQAPPSEWPRPNPAIMVNCMDGSGNVIEGEDAEAL